MARRRIRDSGWRNYLRRVPPNSVLYFPGLECGGSTIKDYSGKANDGTIVGATWTRLPGGLFILDIDGVDDIVTVTDAPSIQNIFDSPGGTLLVWIKPDSDGEGDYGRIIDKNIWQLFVREEAAGKVKLSFGYTFSTQAGSWISTNTVIDINKWSLVGLTYNNSNVANDPVITVNGVSIAVTEGATPIGTRTTDVGSKLIVGNNADTTRTFDGCIALPRALSIKMLSVTQILDIFDPEKLILGVQL